MRRACALSGGWHRATDWQGLAAARSRPFGFRAPAPSRHRRDQPTPVGTSWDEKRTKCMESSEANRRKDSVQRRAFRLACRSPRQSGRPPLPNRRIRPALSVLWRRAPASAMHFVHFSSCRAFAPARERPPADSALEAAVRDRVTAVLAKLGLKNRAQTAVVHHRQDRPTRWHAIGLRARPGRSRPRQGRNVPLS